MDVDIPTEEMEWLLKSVVAKMRDDASLEAVRETVKALNLDTSVIPLSSCNVLLVFKEASKRDEFLKHPGEFMDIVCSEFNS
ncbi:hypothetical protein COLO4_38149 [Corchorus olitorius]|uniref:Uncharacterized protein n=1 Tax=Corchorus olitorius TaxID=93759 RepID=A0A1R3FWN1_9ROSI|nr:hypothetical protein COLO4_38149 [Corchorus olitorius]